MKRDYGVFQAALKIVLHRGDKILFLRDNNARKTWDWPGGRIDNVEYETPLEKIIAREVREELGSRVKYVLGKPVFTLRRWTMWNGEKTCIFCVFYDARFISGEIKLSSEHTAYEWIDPKNFRMKRSDFNHKEEYPAFKKYFAENYHA